MNSDFYINDIFGIEYKLIIQEDIFNSLRIDSIQCFHKNNEVGYAWLKYSKDNTSEAYISYVRILDEYQGKGLSQLMYFYIAQYISNKGIILTNSACQTDLGKKIWINLCNNFSKNISLSKCELGFDKFYLNIPHFENCNFQNGKLIYNLW